MFDIGAPEFLVLLVAAVILFGPEKLPEFARKAAKALRYVRTLAGNAQDQLSKELGPEFKDLDLTDLNPKNFVRKHLLNDVEPIIADVKTDFMESTKGGIGAAAAVSGAINSAKMISSGGPSLVFSGAGTKATVLTPFDPDAT